MLKVLTKGCEHTKGSKYSAAVDLYASEDVVINAGETKIVGLGVAIDLDDLMKREFSCIRYEPHYKEHINGFMESHYLQLEPRSSIRAKGILSGTGVIDLDYPDEIKIILHNLTKEDFTVTKGDRIAQIMLCEHSSYLLGIESEDERTGGIGSTN